MLIYNYERLPIPIIPTTTSWNPSTTMSLCLFHVWLLLLLVDVTIAKGIFHNDARNDGVAAVVSTTMMKSYQYTCRFATKQQVNDFSFWNERKIDNDDNTGTIPTNCFTRTSTNDNNNCTTSRILLSSSLALQFSKKKSTTPRQCFSFVPIVSSTRINHHHHPQQQIRTTHPLYISLIRGGGDDGDDSIDISTFKRNRSQSTKISTTDHSLFLDSTRTFAGTRTIKMIRHCVGHWITAVGYLGRPFREMIMFRPTIVEAESRSTTTISISKNLLIASIVSYINSCIQPIDDPFWKLPTAILLLSTTILSSTSYVSISSRTTRDTLNQFLSILFHDPFNGKRQNQKQQQEPSLLSNKQTNIFSDIFSLFCNPAAPALGVGFLIYSVFVAMLLSDFINTKKSSISGKRIALRYVIHNIPIQLIDNIQNICETIIDEIRYSVRGLIDENDTEFPNTPLMAHWIGYNDVRTLRTTNKNNDNTNRVDEEKEQQQRRTADRVGLNVLVEAHVLERYYTNDTNNDIREKDKDTTDQSTSLIIDNKVQSVINKVVHNFVKKAKIPTGVDDDPRRSSYWIEPIIG